MISKRVSSSAEAGDYNVTQLCISATFYLYILKPTQRAQIHSYVFRKRFILDRFVVETELMPVILAARWENFTSDSRSALDLRTI